MAGIASRGITRKRAGNTAASSGSDEVLLISGCVSFDTVISVACKSVFGSSEAELLKVGCLRPCGWFVFSGSSGGLTQAFAVVSDVALSPLERAESLFAVFSGEHSAGSRPVADVLPLP